MSVRNIVLVTMLLVATTSAQQTPPQVQPAQQSQQQGPPVLPTGTASISGKVVGDDGKPIRGAFVTLSNAALGGGPQKRAVTDADGKYALTGLGTLKYRLAASADHFLSMQFGQVQPGPVGLNNPARPIEIQDGEKFDAADFTLSRETAIDGFVVDEFGDPVPNVTVGLLQMRFFAGKRRLVGAPSQGPAPPTDDRGHFRLSSLVPGDYYLAVLSGAFADPNAAGGFAVTFYPGTTSAGAAQRIQVVPGQDVNNVRFALVPAAMVRVSGTLVDATETPIGRGNVSLLTSERAETALSMSTRAASASDGSFVFRNVPPGTYTIQAFGSSINGQGNLSSFTFGFVTLDVGEKGVDNVRLRIPPPRSIRGKITFDGDPSTLPLADDVYLSASVIDLESGPIGGGPPPFTVHPDWTFEINAMSGLRMLQARGHLINA